MELAYPMAHAIVLAHPTAGPRNGITRGRAASRSPDAADLPPTLVVFSKCGVGKDLDLGTIWGPKLRNFFQTNLCSPAWGQNQYACNIFGSQIPPGVHHW